MKELLSQNLNLQKLTKFLTKPDEEQVANDQTHIKKSTATAAALCFTNRQQEMGPESELYLER